MKLLVFGKTGQVATELARLEGDAFTQAVFLPRDQADLSDPKACAAIITETQADAVINAAAWTAVDNAEEHEAEAMVINADAPGAMARACADRGLPFLHVSTDYVFDGAGETPRKETDPVAPQNAYGRGKLAGENAVRAASGPHAILRTSWVFSSHGANFVKTMLRLSETCDALSIVSDQHGGPTPAADIAAALVKMAHAMVQGQPGGTYHFAGQPDTTWAGFAREIFDQAGRDVTVTGIPTRDFPTPATRPLNSRLDCSALAADFAISRPDWRQGLHHVLDEMRGKN
ncbi:dTDP-4-dehydrorhamnose reductase [Roseovarius litorisediminis]|uniref:dTDP-4-dehydrorhamnose reductase n=1 Tax=Roseovarius litorisediminis TaxID=1312363 RepID=A0A1Y5SSX5_9RHOB|nr:dTDP-4-dehydrorhamnose reductase [Roseovarius litorisediminis]SLN46235.1 dTDP-4-dehydrorhamnose reductase [Roseovarius litorisediminis]